jgi:hypothetical protein
MGRRVKVSLSLDSDAYAKLRALAKAEGRSMSWYVDIALRVVLAEAPGTIVAKKESLTLKKKVR